MSQKKRIPQSSSPDKKAGNKSPVKKRKIFTKANFTKIFLPSLLLIAIILTPVLFEVFSTRHQKIDDVIENRYGDDFNPDDDRTPFIDIFIDADLNDSDGILDDFTNGIDDPNRILFKISPTNEYLYWRLETYDTYTMDNWDKNITVTEISGYSSLPSFADGELEISAELLYSDGSLVGYFPAPYHYQYGESFSNDISFDPINDWTTTNLYEDMYNCKLIEAQFDSDIGNTTVDYNVSYTLQDNEYIKNNSQGFSTLNSIVSSNQVLEDRYLQIPQDYSLYAPYTTQIANSLLDTSNTIYEQVFRNMIWLSSNCSYDIEMLFGNSDDAPAEDEDYVEWFLNRRSGTAAHFAAALAMISRIQDIPSRMVVGFSSGDLIGSEFVVRAQHIHSWVEVFIPLSGTMGYWVAFDPSPLIPSIRDQYGENTIGFQPVFYCTNEFFISPLHMIPQPSYPYFVPNPLSDAWYNDPYDPSNWYGPYVNRSDSFDIFAFLANGKDEDFFQYLLTGDPGGLEFVEDEQITFIDTTTDTIMGSAITNADGRAQLSYNYSISDPSGLHLISAEWLGIQVPTYDLRYFPVSLIETGVIVTGSVNISSYLPQEMYEAMQILTVPQLNNSYQYDLITNNINFLTSDFLICSYYTKKPI